jgi:hypothetical protein
MEDMFGPCKKYQESDAVISDCGKYRYLLRRVWDFKQPRVLFVMLNPSTADASIDDPTIKSCVRLSKTWSYGSMEVVNLFAWRATDPDQLPKADFPTGVDNDGVTRNAIGRCDVVVCAWGKHEFAKDRAKIVRSMVTSIRPAVYCLGKNKDGSPKHPLYIKSGTTLQTF